MDIKGIPLSEKRMTRHITKDGKLYITTTNRDRSSYFLYIIEDGVARRLGKGATPKSVEERFIKWE